MSSLVDHTSDDGQSTRSLDVPVTMSLPAILRDPRNRFAHLHGLAPKPSPNKAGETAGSGAGARVEGKRKALRRENSRFGSNPHIVAPQRSDFGPTLPNKLPTFPSPLPPYLPRLSVVPSPPPPERDEQSAQAGRFTIGLRGARKDLRRRGLYAEKLVRVIEAELSKWLELGMHAYRERPVGPSPGILVDSAYDHCLGGAIVEVYRTPIQLVWKTEDAMARYVIHCTARWHSIVSFSKDVSSGERHTTLLRPNVVVPDHSALVGLDTPPPTDQYQSPAIMDTDESDASSSIYDSEVSEDTDISGRPGRARSVVSDRATDITDGDLADPEYSSSDESGFLVVPEADVDMTSDDEPLRDRLEDLSITDAAVQPADLARSLNRMQLRNGRNRRSRSSPSPSPVRLLRSPRASVVDQPPRARRSSPIGRGRLPELERRRPGRPAPRTQSFWDYVFS